VLTVVFAYQMLVYVLGIAIPDPGIPDRFLIPKSRDYERPNPGISGL